VSSVDLTTEPPPARPAPVSPEPPPEPAAEPIETVIEPRKGWRVLNLSELWRYRELLYLLAWRDVAVRYKQTALGVAWVVLQPLTMMAVFSVFLARVGGVGDKVEHYPLYVLAGLLTWGLFSGAITSAAGSLVGNQNLVTKVYFPRLIMPVSAALVGLVDFAVGLGLLGVVMAVFRVDPGWGVLLVPVLTVLLIVSALGVGVLLAALSVAYRDFRHVIPFGVQVWMFATPVIYLPVEVLGETARILLPLNPAYGLILNFRQAVLGGPLDWYALGVSSAVGVLGFLVGALYFRRVERSFADII
jgi:lipopolysaccharide transport system permease protein